MAFLMIFEKMMPKTLYNSVKNHLPDFSLISYCNYILMRSPWISMADS